MSRFAAGLSLRAGILLAFIPYLNIISNNPTHRLIGVGALAFVIGSSLWWLYIEMRHFISEIEPINQTDEVHR